MIKLVILFKLQVCSSLCFVICLFSCVLLPYEVHAKQSLTIAAIAQNRDVRESYYSLARKFERLNPEVEIKFLMKDDRVFKQELDKLISTPGAVDIVSWHAGERLDKYVKQGLVLSITDDWYNNKLSNNFGEAMKKVVSVNQQVYAIPISYYQWGIYYKKSVFTRLNLSAPRTWLEFEKVLQTLKKNKIMPIFMSSKNIWPVGNWFEYLNLRINGHQYHQKFVKGLVSAESVEIKKVLGYWKKMIDAEYFMKEHQNKILADSYPFIFREQVGMVLSGNFIETTLPESLKSDVGFFSFPQINEQIANILVTPIDIMFIPKSSQQHTLAKQFILFMADKKNQAIHSENIYQFPVNVQAEVIYSDLLKEIRFTLESADGFSRFYDREVEEQYGQENMRIWIDFLDTANIEQTVERMEAARKRYLLRTKAH